MQVCSAILNWERLEPEINRREIQLQLLITKEAMLSSYNGLLKIIVDKNKRWLGLRIFLDVSEVLG